MVAAVTRVDFGVSILADRSTLFVQQICWGGFRDIQGTATALLAKDRLLPSAPVRSAARESWLRILASTNLLLPRPGRRLLVGAAPASNQNGIRFPARPNVDAQIASRKKFSETHSVQHD
jgi:hypothetical protein